jgi:hypothetical protein
MLILTYGAKTKYYKENKEAVLLTSKEVGLEADVEKTKYMFVSRHQIS